MITMSDDAVLERINELIDELLVRRSAREENDLCRIVRLLPDKKKLAVVERLGCSNVRLAASIAARVHLSVEQQLILLSHVLCEGKSNAIKQFAIGLFAFRLSSKSVLRVLMGLNDKHPGSVRLMAYYYVGVAKGMSSVNKRRLQELSRTAAKDGLK